jgi:hypothetical protein
LIALLSTRKGPTEVGALKDLKSGPWVGERALYQATLIFRKFSRHIIDWEPLSLSDLKTAGLRSADGPGLEVDFDLSRARQRARKQHLHLFQDDANFFAQLAAQSRLWLLTLVQEPARQTPTAVGPKHVFEQENATFGVKDDGAGGDGKAPLARAYQATADAAGQAAPDSAKKFR